MTASFEVDLIQLFLSVCGSALVALVVATIWYFAVNYKIVPREDGEVWK